MFKSHILAVGTVLLLSVTHAAFGQSAEGFWAQAVSNVLERSNRQRADTEFIPNTLGIFGGDLTEGGAVQQTSNLEAGRTYIFVGAGDNDARDVAVSVKDMNGQEVASDSEFAEPSVPM